MTENKNLSNSAFSNDFEFTPELMEKLSRADGIIYNEDELAEISELSDDETPDD